MHAARRLGAREANLIKGNVGQQQKRAKEMEDEEFFFPVVGPCAGVNIRRRQNVIEIVDSKSNRISLSNIRPNH